MDRDQRDDRTTETTRPSAREAVRDAPPGSEIIDSSRSGQEISDNPVVRLHRDAGDVLAEEVREGEFHDEDL